MLNYFEMKAFSGQQEYKLHDVAVFVLSLLSTVYAEHEWICIENRPHQRKKRMVDTSHNTCEMLCTTLMSQGNITSAVTMEFNRRKKNQI